MEIILAILWGIVLGISFTIVNPLLIAGAIIGLMILPFILRHPEYSLVGMIIAYSTITNVDLLPLIPIGIGSLNIMDLALAGFIGIVVFRRLTERGYVVMIQPVGVAIIIFFGMALISTIIGLLQGTTSLDNVTTELRYIGYYLAYFVMFLLCKDEDRIRFIIISFLLLAFVVAFAMILQFIVGPEVTIIYGRIEEFAQEGVTSDEVARIIPSGRYLLYLAFNIVPLLVIFEKKFRIKLIYAIIWGFLSIGILLTFNRNFWVSSALVQFICLFSLDPQRRANLTKIWVTALLILIMVAILFSLNPNTVIAKTINSAVTRFTSIFDSGSYTNQFDSASRTSSLEFRRIENSLAEPYLFPPRIIGLGMGARYRDTVPSIDSDSFDGRTYIHNSHYWIIIKAGIVSYISLIAAMLITIYRGFKHWRRIPNRYQPFFMASSIALVGILLSATVDPILTDLTWSPICGILLGLNEAIFNLKVDISPNV